MGERTPAEKDSISLLDLRSTNSSTSRRTWDAAYTLLWREGMMVARCALTGAEHEAQREDIVATAVTQISQGIIERTGDSYNELRSFDDVLGMMRSITRCRVVDFLRQRQRRKEDTMEELPEPSPETVPDLPYTLEEIMAEVEKLPPPMPDLFSDRFLLGWNTAEIAERRKLNGNTVLTYFYKGFKLLRERLEGWEGASLTPSRK